MDFSSLQFMNTLLQWVIAPVAGFVWILYRVQNSHEIRIAVLAANIEALQKSHEREVKSHEREITAIRETSSAIMAKLNSIEEALRK